MRTTHQEFETAEFDLRTCGTCRDAVREFVARAKEKLFHEFAPKLGEHANILRLALNEAEALAWDTEFPQLFFPALAAEKAQSAVTWARRQRAVRRRAVELAFAE
jgi:predicted secreted hydrolase